MRFSPLILFLLVLPLVAADFEADGKMCSTENSCCEMCGPDSVRCARGPCSTNFIMADIFDLSMPLEPSFLNIAATFYGMVPYVLPFLVLLDILFWHRTWARVFGLMVVACIAIVYLILHKAAGHCEICARPCGACVSNSGLPSGHAANAAGLTLWMIVEMSCGFGKRFSPSKRMLYVSITLILFGPVAWSRVYLGDHSLIQVLVGTVHGILVTFFYELLVRTLVRHRHLVTASRRIARLTNDHMKFTDDYTLDRRSSAERPLLQA